MDTIINPFEFKSLHACWIHEVYFYSYPYFFVVLLYYSLYQENIMASVTPFFFISFPIKRDFTYLLTYLLFKRSFFFNINVVLFTVLSWFVFTLRQICDISLTSQSSLCTFCKHMLFSNLHIMRFYQAVSLGISIVSIVRYVN